MAEPTNLLHVKLPNPAKGAIIGPLSDGFENLMKGLPVRKKHFKDHALVSMYCGVSLSAIQTFHKQISPIKVIFANCLVIAFFAGTLMSFGFLNSKRDFV